MANNVLFLSFGPAINVREGGAAGDGGVRDQREG